MGLIAVEGMLFYAYHGFYEEERIIGNEYQVDIYVESDFKKAAQNDDLEDTINYESIHLVAKSEMARSTKLLETLCDRMANRLKSQFTNIETLKIRISKKNPPMKGIIARSFVEMDYDHKTKCPKTKKSFLCYKDDNCWCKNVKVNEETLTTIKKKYKGCLSREALEFYAR
ncbi:MAG: dihydroneopterin aldolase [Bacteroidota bacterium]